MNEMYIISFNSTHQAIKCDKAFGKNEIDYTVLPTPREISQSCGMSIRFGLEDIDTIKEIIDQNQIEYKSMYRIFKEIGSIIHPLFNLEWGNQECLLLFYIKTAI